MLACAALAASLINDRRLLLATGAAWLAFAVWAFVVVATSASTFGATRPGDVAAALALALLTAVPALVPASLPVSSCNGSRDVEHPEEVVDMHGEPVRTQAAPAHGQAT